MTTRNDIAKNIGEGLGALVWWDLDRTAIRPADLRTILASEGDSTVVPDVDPLKGMKRAVGAFTMGRGNQNRYRANVAYEDDDALIVGIVNLQKAGKKKVVWPQVASFRYDKHSGMVTRRNAPKEHAGAVASFEKLATRMMTHLDHQWIRPNLIQSRLSNWGGFSLRRQGGVTFVASQFLPELDVLSRIIGAIGDSALHIAHVEASDQSRASIGSSAEMTLASKMEELRSQLDEWMSGTTKARPSSIASMLSDFGELRDRAMLYADALKITVDDLMGEIEEAKDTAQALLGNRMEDVETRNIAPRTVAKLEKLFEVGRQEDGTVLVNEDTLSAVKLGVNWLRHKSRWTEGGAAANEAARFGLYMTDRSFNHVTLSPASS